MATPSVGEIRRFSDFLWRSLGDSLQMIILHGSLTNKDYPPSENRDADLVIVVSDVVLNTAFPLIQEIRNREFRDLNLALNIVGFYQLIQYVKSGHPFFINAILQGRFVHFLYKNVNSEHTEFREQIRNMVDALDKEQVVQYLEQLSQNEELQADGAFREFYGRLTNILWSKAQIKILSAFEGEIDANMMQNLANWEWILSQLAKIGISENEIDFLKKVYQSKTLVSRYLRPEIGGDLYSTLEKIKQILG